MPGQGAPADEYPAENLIRAARGEINCDLLISNIRLVNLLAGEIYPTEVAIQAGYIVGFGDYTADTQVDGQGAYLAPGLIDGHVHIESSLLAPVEFANAVVPHGTTTLICDPHEIVNVSGAAGLEFMLTSSADLPLDIFFMLPSCVPATDLETAGARLKATDLQEWIDHPRVLGLGELMNYPGVLMRDPEVMAKMRIGRSRLIDGHAPLVTGRDLSAYISAGIGSDHESTALAEAREKLRKGMFLMIREGSAARNLETLLPLVNHLNARGCGFVTDDRHPDFLMDHGHIDSMVRTSLSRGLDPLLALSLGSLNTARHFGLQDRGAIAPGYRADLILFDDFENFNIRQVYHKGRLVAQEGQMIAPASSACQTTIASVNCPPVDIADLELRARSRRMQVIEIIPGQILTRKVICDATVVEGCAVSDPQRDIFKIAVIERHRATGNIGLGFVRGLGLRNGALGSTVAHDSHNIIVVGTNDKDMLTVIETIRNLQGGQVVVSQGEVLAALPLPIAGLMSTQPLAAVREMCDRLANAARQLGCGLENPFMTLSFLALPVIPELKITDRGLVDTAKFAHVELFIPD